MAQFISSLAGFVSRMLVHLLPEIRMIVWKIYILASYILIR